MQNTWKNLPEVSHSTKIKSTIKKWSRHQSSTTAEWDHQTFTYSFMARTTTAGPFCPSHFQTHVNSLGCSMYSGKKQHSANAHLQIYISAARSHLDRTWLEGLWYQEYKGRQKEAWRRSWREVTDFTTAQHRLWAAHPNRKSPASSLKGGICAVHREPHILPF